MSTETLAPEGAPDDGPAPPDPVDALARLVGLLENALEDGTLLPSGDTAAELSDVMATAQRSLDHHWSLYRCR